MVPLGNGGAATSDEPSNAERAFRRSSGEREAPASSRRRSSRPLRIRRAPRRPGWRVGPGPSRRCPRRRARTGPGARSGLALGGRLPDRRRGSRRNDRREQQGHGGVVVRARPAVPRARTRLPSASRRAPGPAVRPPARPCGRSRRMTRVGAISLGDIGRRLDEIGPGGPDLHRRGTARAAGVDRCRPGRRAQVVERLPGIGTSPAWRNHGCR